MRDAVLLGIFAVFDVRPGKNRRDTVLHDLVVACRIGGTRVVRRVIVLIECDDQKAVVVLRDVPVIVKTDSGLLMV